MPFKRFVETGRVAYIADGQDKGKLCTIVDVIDQTRALIDGPETGVSRNQIRLNQLHLTKFRIKFPYTGSTRVVRKAWKDAKINEKWENTIWAKKLVAKSKRAEMTDFDRFKLRRARQLRNKIRSKAFFVMKAKSKRAGTLWGNSDPEKKKKKQERREKNKAKKQKPATAGKKK